MLFTRRFLPVLLKNINRREGVGRVVKMVSKVMESVENLKSPSVTVTKGFLHPERQIASNSNENIALRNKFR
jgi:hypothetical protein